jgi:hypothetical protein
MFMNKMSLIVAGLAVLGTIGHTSAPATEVTSNCLSCETIQHAVNLSEIERYLQQGNPQSVAQLDEEAREWFSTFQEGGIFFDGWKDISDKVINNVPESEKVQTKLQMLALGVRMGCEWSKENEIRKISTKMLKNWGQEIREVVKTRPTDIPHVINKIEGEVDALLFAVQ